MLSSVIISTLSWYLIFAMVLWKFNPGTWDTETRSAWFLMSFLLLMVILSVRFPSVDTLTWI